MSRFFIKLLDAKGLFVSKHEVTEMIISTFRSEAIVLCRKTMNSSLKSEPPSQVKEFYHLSLVPEM